MSNEIEFTFPQFVKWVQGKVVVHSQDSAIGSDDWVILDTGEVAIARSNAWSYDSGSGVDPPTFSVFESVEHAKREGHHITPPSP